MTRRICEDCAETCSNEATVKVRDESGGPEYAYCDQHAPTRDPGVTPADLASRLGWLPCQTCGGTDEVGQDGKRSYALNPAQGPCPFCVQGWLPSPAVLEAMAEAIYEDQRNNNLGQHSFQAGPWKQVGNYYGAKDDYLSQARAAWEAQARLMLEGEK